MLISNLARRLLNATLAVAGAGLMGFNWALAYAPGTIGAALRQGRNIRTFGAFIGDGVSDDSAVWLAAAASGPGIIDARGVTSKCLSQINVGTGQTWLLHGATLNFSGSANRLFSCITVNDWNIVGPVKIVGDLTVNPGEAVTSAGIYVSDCLRWHVDSVTGINIRGSVIESVPGGSTAARGEHGTVDGLVGKDCVWMWKDSPGSGAEYCTVSNFRATGMAAAGIQTAAGNTVFSAGHLVDNYDNVRLLGGSNNLHGIFDAVNINHATRYILYADGVTNGSSFADCHFYANNAAGGGAIYLKNCKKIVFDGGTLDAWVYNDNGAGSGLNYIRNMYCPGDYGDVKLLTTAAGLPELVVTDCFGPGASTLGVTINTSATVHVELERQFTVVDVFTTGVAKTCTWPSVAMDKRAVYVAGEFIVPAGEGGPYRLMGSQVFEATTINEAASYLEVQVQFAAGGGYVVHDPCLASAKFGATMLVFSHNSRLILKAGDKVRVRGVIVGTGVINHGHASYRSWATFEKAV